MTTVYFMSYFSVLKFYYHWTLNIRFSLPIHLNCIDCLAKFALRSLTCLMIAVMARFSSLLPITTSIRMPSFQNTHLLPRTLPLVKVKFNILT